jgi:LPS export ABC transporter protein LptC
VSLTYTTYRYWAVPAAVSVLLLLSLISCENDPATVEGLGKKQIGIEKAINVALNYTQAGKIKARLTAPEMLRVQDTIVYVEFNKTMHVDFYNGDTIIQSRLDAKYAKYTESRNVVFLKDSVRVISINGDTLLCNELFWDRSRHGLEFYTRTPVVVKTKTNIIYGQKGMEVSQDLKNRNFYEVTNSLIRVPSSQFPQ